jgi:hypothetical protein
MLIPSKDVKSYGAIHVDNYLSFIGFCKKVDSEDIQTVDVYLDNKRINSLKANENIEKIEKIYKVKKHSFKYELPSEYYDRTHLLQFKCENEELVNSPIKTISEDTPKFNEYKFLNKIKNQISNISNFSINDYKEKHISFFAIEENISDNKFIEFIKEIKQKFKDCILVACVFTQQEEKKITDIFKEIKIVYLSDIKDLYNSTEVFISNRKYDFKKVLEIENYIILNNTEINVISYDIRLASMKLIDYERRINKSYNPYKDDFEKVGLSFIQNSITETICYQLMDLDKKTFKLDEKTFKDMCTEMIYSSLHCTDTKLIFNKANRLRALHNTKKD